MQTLHHIVVVGGGAGGLELVTKLGHKLGKKNRARITLVDASLTHVWKPLLHEVAAGSLNSDAAQVNYRAHAQQHYFEFQLGKLCGLDRTKKRIFLEPMLDRKGTELVAQRELSYDTLVIAVGSSANDFGTPGAKDNCLFLDSLRQANGFHRILLNVFLNKEFDSHTEQEKIKIAIVGAGATGVELAAELRHASQHLSFYGMHNINASKVEISLIEAAERILPALPDRISFAATKQLHNLDVSVLTKNMVQEVTDKGFMLKDKGLLEADLKVWAAGIKAPEFLKTLDGLETNRINQLKVSQTLQTTLDENIFALGDCAECIQISNGKPVPPRAQAAHQQSSTLVKTLINKLNGEAPVPFEYRDYGSLISFSKHSTVGNLMGNLLGKSMFIEGRVARAFYLSLYRMHQLAIHGYIRTGLIWLSDKIMKAVNPKIKLH